jgi:mRNA-degrading endonuclease RelE of RelBE toxin-antitoxin system
VQIWKVELVPEAQNDFSSLDGSVRKRVLKQLVKLEQNPNYGDPLGNKAGINLEGYFKISGTSQWSVLFFPPYYELCRRAVQRQ